MNGIVGHAKWCDRKGELANTSGNYCSTCGQLVLLQTGKSKADRHLERVASDAETLARAVSASLTHGEQSPLAEALSTYLEKHPWSDL